MQEKSSLTSAPVLRVADIVEKGRALDREVNYLLNKMKIAKSKAKTEKKDKKPAESAAKSNDTTKHKPEDSGDNVSQDDSTLQDIKDNEDDTNQEKTPAVDEEGTGREGELFLLNLALLVGWQKYFRECFRRSGKCIRARIFKEAD